MSDSQLQTPVAFIVFNRPDTTAKVFSEIAKARPRKLLLIADGPRANRVGEAERCAATRKIVEQVDWPCEVSTNFSTANLGCRTRLASGIDWVFDEVEEAIILEDDCVPDPSFFRFCEEMLERYRLDDRVALVSGDNFQFGRLHGESSYYFSQYAHVWGWATWRRMWRNYDKDATDWPRFKRENKLSTVLGATSAQIRFWEGVLDAVHAGTLDTWDFQLNLAMWQKGMLGIVPQSNLIRNIGFGAAATHTKLSSPFADMDVQPMRFPLRHPAVVEACRAADAYTASQMFLPPTLFSQVVAKLRAIYTGMRESLAAPAV